MLITKDKALRLILENTFVLGCEKVSLVQAIDRILACDIVAQDNLPPFNNSAMDGFAVRNRDLISASQDNPVTLKVRDVVKAGAFSSTRIRSGEAFKIMTGAPIPMGADSVVMKEMAKTNDSLLVEIFQAPCPGENIRSQGEDVKAGSLILKKGTLIRSYELALLATQGFKFVSVVKKPKASIVATGDELLDVSCKLTPGHIRNSNGPAIVALLWRWGIPSKDLGIIKDEPKSMTKTFQRALKDSDVSLVSGGVSVGDFDFTRKVLEGLGAKIIFHRVAIKPGKPLLFGSLTNKLVFGLPGNPVAALVCLEEFVRPALEKLQGHAPGHPSYHLEGILDNEYPKDPKRQQYLFCQARRDNDQFTLHVIRPQGSAMLGMACQANALAIAPEGARLLQKGTKVSFRWLK